MVHGHTTDRFQKYTGYYLLPNLEAQATKNNTGMPSSAVPMKKLL